MKKVLPVLAVVLIFVLGLGIMLYPTIANYVNARSQTVAIDHYEEAARANAAYYEGLLEQAQAFNREIFENGGLVNLTDEQKAAYETLLNLNGDGVMGYIEIPRLELKLSIGHGTEEDVLQRMVGHIEGSSLPVGGESTHAVLSAHRGLPTAKLFSDLDLMQVGDRFTIHTLNQTLTYQVDQITVILPEEIEALARNLPEVKRIRFFMTFGQSYLTHMKCLENVGMLSTTPVEFNGQQIVPIQFLKTLLPDPASLGPRTVGKTNIGCIITGVKDGKEKTIYIYNVCDHQECYKELGCQAVAYTTGVPAMIGAAMVLSGQWSKKGVYTTDEFDPDPYMQMLNEYGLPWVVEENPETVA